MGGPGGERLERTVCQVKVVSSVSHLRKVRKSLVRRRIEEYGEFHFRFQNGTGLIGYLEIERLEKMIRQGFV